jgi:nicotinic acid phosphoribosyltransferase
MREPLNRRTRVATNTRLVVEAAWPKGVMFFPARLDHWLVQTGDGYAPHIAGAVGVSTDAFLISHERRWLCASDVKCSAI